MWPLFFRKRKRKKAEVEDPLYDADAHFSQLLKNLRQRLTDLLVTRKHGNASIKKNRNWELFKTGKGLFRLDADGLSLMINTVPFLVQAADGKVQGLVRMGEVDLCDAIHESITVSDFVSRVEAPDDLQSQTLYTSMIDQTIVRNTPGRLPAINELLSWEVFDQDQMIVRNSINTLAHVLVHANPKLELLLRSRISSRLQIMLMDELESMANQHNRNLENPHTHQRPLRKFEPALKEFRQSMQTYLNDKKNKHRALR